MLYICMGYTLYNMVGSFYIYTVVGYNHVPIIPITYLSHSIPAL